MACGGTASTSQRLWVSKPLASFVFNHVVCDTVLMSPVPAADSALQTSSDAKCQLLPCAVAGSLKSMRAEHHPAFTKGFTTARVVLMNRSASGLSVRFFKVVMAIVPRALSRATGNALSEGCLPGNINV